MSSARKLRRMKQSQATKMLPELTGKMGHVIEVGERIAHVSGQIGEVNGKLADLDNLILMINETKNLVTQSLQEGRAVHEELARQRFVNLKMFHRSLPPGFPFEDAAAMEQKFRDEFDLTLQAEVDGTEDDNPQE